VLLDLIKSFGKNLLAAKNLTAVTLPVVVFEPRSYLQRLADGWWGAPHFLQKAADILLFFLLRTCSHVLSFP